MKNGLFVARILSIIAILGFALPVFADTIILTPSQAGGLFIGGNATYAVRFPSGYFFGTATGAPNYLPNGTISFSIHGVPTSSSGTVFDYSSGFRSKGGRAIVPEPGTLGLLGTGLVVIAGMFRRSRLGPF